MSDAPRRRRADGWAWVYFALFGADGGGEGTAYGPASDTGDSDGNDGRGPEG
jgi:hypothetical protein